MNGRRIVADFTVFGRGYMRNPVALFFSLIFPIILIGIFGVIFSGGPSTITVYAQNLDHNSNASVQFLSALNGTGAMTIQVVTFSGNFSGYLAQNHRTAGLVMPAGFAAALANRTLIRPIVYVDPTQPATQAIVEGAVQGVVNGYNLKLANGSVVIAPEFLYVGSRASSQIDFLVPGLIGFTVLTSPMFSLVDISSTYKKEKLFRQLSLTPLTKAEWLASKILFYTILTFVSAGIMVGFGAVAFGAHVTLTWAVVPFLILGPLLFVSLGMLAGSAAPTPESAAIVGNLITFPMMFLSGTFFAVSLFPPFWQKVALFLPLYYLIDGMDSVMIFSDSSRALYDAAIVLGLAVIVFVAAVTAFKWRED